MESEALEKLDGAARETLKELYGQCTPEEQQFFCRMYRSLEEVPADRVRWAIQQCENTIRKHEREEQE